MTSEQLALYELRRDAANRRKTVAADVPDDAVAAGDEGKLQAAILRHHKDYGQGLGWVCLHGGMNKKTNRTLGETDFIIVNSIGTHFVECKTRTGKLSPEQIVMRHLLLRNGARYRVIRSMREYLEFVNGGCSEIS